MPRTRKKRENRANNTNFPFVLFVKFVEFGLFARSVFVIKSVLSYTSSVPNTFARQFKEYILQRGAPNTEVVELKVARLRPVG